jgi:hypothetical protein
MNQSAKYSAEGVKRSEKRRQLSRLRGTLAAEAAMATTTVLEIMYFVLELTIASKPNHDEMEREHSIHMTA